MPADFVWEVPAHGFRWIASEGTIQLSERAPAGGRRQVRRYRPLDRYPALFRIFAGTPPTEDGILAFANQYGVLGLSNESLQGWACQIGQLRFAVTLWNAIEAGDIETVRRYVKVKEAEGGQTILYRHDDEPEPIEANVTLHALAGPPDTSRWVFIPAHLMQYFPPGDSIHGALFLVQEIIDQRLRVGMATRMRYDAEQDRLGLQVVPKSLLGALWFRFARSIDEHQRYRQCLECGIWFEISDEGSRSSRLFHSNACRSKAYRKRQATAQQFFASGVSVEMIAEQLESDVKTVQGWLTDAKRRRSQRS
jgi:transposase-like protein